MVISSEWAGLPVSPTLPYLRISKVCLMHPGYQVQTMHMMDTKIKYCVSWILYINIVIMDTRHIFFIMGTRHKQCVSWIPYINIVYQGYWTNIVYRE